MTPLCYVTSDFRLQSINATILELLQLLTSLKLNIQSSVGHCSLTKQSNSSVLQFTHTQLLLIFGTLYIYCVLENITPLLAVLQTYTIFPVHNI